MQHGCPLLEGPACSHRCDCRAGCIADLYAFITLFPVSGTFPEIAAGWGRPATLLQNYFAFKFVYKAPARTLLVLISSTYRDGIICSELGVCLPVGGPARELEGGTQNIGGPDRRYRTVATIVCAPDSTFREGRSY